jgi:hypothetical protein
MKNIKKLVELVEEEHCNGCGQSTCDISAAFNAGFTLWAVYLFSNTGAGSEEFGKLYNGLPKSFKKQASKECDEFIKTVTHAECSHCNAVTWDIDINETEIYCDNCGKTFTKS